MASLNDHAGDSTPEVEPEPVRGFKRPIQSYQRSFIGTVKGKDVLLPDGDRIQLDLEGENVVVTVIKVKVPDTSDQLLKARVESWIGEKTERNSPTASRHLANTLFDTAMHLRAASEVKPEPVRGFEFPILKHQRSFIGNLKGRDILIPVGHIPGQPVPMGHTVRLNLKGENVDVTVVATHEQSDLVLKAQVESWIREKTRRSER